MDMKTCNLTEDLAQVRSKWKNRIHGANPSQLGQGLDDNDDFKISSKPNVNNFFSYSFILNVNIFLYFTATSHQLQK